MGLTMAEGVPRAALRPYVTRLCAYQERYDRPLTRTEPAVPGAVLILAFGAPMEVGGARLTSFTGGLGDRATVTRVAAPTEGVEVLLTPFGARRLFGVPMRELTNLVLPVDDLLPGWGRTAGERLAGLTSSAARLALAESLLAARILAAPPPDPPVRWAWDRLVASCGSVSVASLARSLGWSHRHLVARFHDQVGLTPKASARVIRFDRAMSLLREGLPLSEVAASCGFYDQPHMNREFRAMAGAPPGQIFPRPQVGAGADLGS
ncbi:helix-turn-helix domain-containing protein [Nonomuraea africana]|uniref:AraC-like DNA-binding protein n=1 Tax=Nonomuraea africana TaxID=46171 RepID=A0ABR9K7K6_9ACTN|nr:AraC family transcriptional regulator [Nonomuraea africana]MBE1557790.1 AraC-like DNA-binding protein [Nonomuraea africana]